MAEPKAEGIPLNPESDFFDNIGEKLDNKHLDSITEELIAGFDSDEKSLSELEQTRNEYDSLFNLSYEQKNSPWDGAASVKIPTIVTACTNFWARAGINLFPADNKIVNVLPVDSSSDSIAKSERVKKHMNWQLMTMPNFFSGFSKSLMSLPKDGYAFRKTYWDSSIDKVITEPVLPQNFIVNYYTKELSTSMRYTQKLQMTVNDIKIKMRQGIYLNVDDISENTTTQYEEDSTSQENKKDAGQEQPTEVDYTTPRDVLEIHTFLHIGDDEIRRPFIVTIDVDSRKILRIIDRRDPITGETMHYFTNYVFIPNPNSIFGFGFGALLLGVTATMNTGINQTLNAAALSTQRGGWVLKGSQMNRGDQHFKIGQFKQVSIRGDDLRKAILPLEFAPPSQVILNLIEFLQNYVDKLTTVTEVFSGIQKSDTTATGATIAVEQGAKVFTSIQQGIHRSFKEELRKIYTLNGLYLDQTEYIDVVTDGSPESLIISIEDYNDPIDVIPVSDPNVISDQQLSSRAEFLAQVVLSNPFLAQDPAANQLVMERRLQAAQVNQGDIAQLKELMIKAVETIENQKQLQEIGQSDESLKAEASQLESQLSSQ